MADLARIESFQYPAAHYGHLNDNQQQQLDTFKQLSEKEGYYTPAVPGHSDASHDDETLLPPDALQQFKDTEEWRKEHGIDNLFNTIDADEYEQTRRLYPQWLGRRDKRGIPVYLFEVAPLNTKTTGAYEKALKDATTTSSKVSTKNLRLFALYENLTNFVLPLCSAVERKHPETPVSQSNNIVDISGVGLKQFWNLKTHMQDASQLATAHYPETLDRIFIIGAPAFFPTVWGWIKRWFDPITVSKIFILSSANVYPTLSQYIEPENIPNKYGGKLDFEWGDMPHLEPEIESQIQWVNPEVQRGKNTFPIGPMNWERQKDGTLSAIAVGSENGKPRRRIVFTIPNPINSKATKGQTIPNTPIAEEELQLTSAGTHTQPPDPDPGVVDLQTPPSDSPSPSGTPKAASTSESKSADKAAELPFREGTSDTRYEQQHHTHAAGQLADGTPHAAVNDHGHGDKTVTMEPATVGQAPKDVSIPKEEVPAPGYLDQAKNVASSAATNLSGTVSAAASTVAGLASGSKGEEETNKKVTEKDPAQKEAEAKIDSKEDPAIEGFLRSKTASASAST